ncbi:hypothetical protein MJ561_18315 [Klebsiella pneumoniae]|nr:hypothetical protein MJ561_18315 [Klebsiella pneumoniae]
MQASLFSGDCGRHRVGSWSRRRRPQFTNGVLMTLDPRTPDGKKRSRSSAPAVGVGRLYPTPTSTRLPPRLERRRRFDNRQSQRLVEEPRDVETVMGKKALDGSGDQGVRTTWSISNDKANITVL